MGKIQDNFCRNLKALRKKYGLSEWQTGRILKLSDETMEALGQGIVTEEVDTGTLHLIYGYYGITPGEMLGDEEI